MPGKKGLTEGRGPAIIPYNKPVTERSTSAEWSSESGASGASAVSGSGGEWTREGGTNSLGSVVPDGSFTRYPGSAHVGARSKRACEHVNLGGIAEAE